MRNLHLTFDWHSKGQKQGEDFAKFCGLLIIYGLYKSIQNILPFPVDDVDSATIPLAVVLLVVATTKIVLEYIK